MKQELHLIEPVMNCRAHTGRVLRLLSSVAHCECFQVLIQRDSDVVLEKLPAFEHTLQSTKAKALSISQEQALIH